MPDERVREWADRLEGLIRDGIRAAQEGRWTDAAEIQRRLREFKEESPSYADSLDRQATLAILDIDTRASQAAVAGLTSRIEAIDRLRKLIDGVSAEAGTDAGSLRLTRARAAIDATTETIRAMQDLARSLGNKQSDQALAKDIESAVKLIQTVRSKVEAL